jgi:hypothetical protein
MTSSRTRSNFARSRKPIASVPTLDASHRPHRLVAERLEAGLEELEVLDLVVGDEDALSTLGYGHRRVERLRGDHLEPPAPYRDLEPAGGSHARRG